MERLPPFVREVFVLINWSKHFGPQFPDKQLERPEFDAEEYLEEINFDGLVSFISSLRDGMPCEIVKEYFGHYNLVYDIEFQDKAQWIARIPLPFRQYQCDDKVTEGKVQGLLFESMVAAQTFARMKKSVFAPAIHASFAGRDNAVGVPFVVMQKIVNDFRLDECISHLLEADLRSIFSDLAREMVSLASPPYFTQIGSLIQNGQEYEVGPMVSASSLLDEPVQLGSRGPYSTVEEYFMSALNRRTAAALRDQNRELYVQSIRLRALLPNFVDPRFNSGPFILSPFDWDARNIFFTDDCAISGVIDWDFASVVPLQSFFRYPPFMTRDWLTDTKSPLMESYRRLFRECLAELQDETELPLLELLDQSRWFQMLDESIHCSELGTQTVPVLEAVVGATKNKKVEIKAIPVVSAVPVLKDIKTSGGKGKVGVSESLLANPSQ